MKLPDWDHWKHRVDVELWEAAFLSCNIDPNLLDYRDIRNCGMGNEKVFERLRLLKDNFHLREFFSPGRIYLGDDNCNVVRLYEYAKWCIYNGTDIPGGLSNIAVGPNIYEHLEAQKQKEGRYTLQEAADFIEQKTGEFDGEMKPRLISVVACQELPVYLPGSKERYYDTLPSDLYEEAYWDDLNDWLKKNERHLAGIFPDPSATSVVARDNPNTIRNQLREIKRSDILNEPILKAIEAANSTDTGKVFFHLKEAALNSQTPFDGNVQGDKLYYTNYSNIVIYIDKSMLNKRLSRLVLPTT